MRRRPRPVLDATTGREFVVPPHLARFNSDEWPGVTLHERWEAWWGARRDWQDEREAPDEVLDHEAAMESQPRLTADDIRRLI